MLRRLYHDQPETFAFTDANRAWAEGQMTKFPEGRQASAVIPLLWRAQEQEGWLSRPAIEHIAKMLDMEYIRVLEVATFYFMFQLQPVGSVAHIQVCGTLSCMICGAEDLIGVCRDKIAPKAHQLSDDGKFSWEEVECLGSCANAPMAQIGKDYYEDLTADKLADLIDRMAAGEVPVPGPQNGRFASEPLGGLTSLKDHDSGKAQYNASAQLAVDIGDTLKRIDGTEVPLLTPWNTAKTADKDPVAASRDAQMAPEGPDGKQGGRVAGDDAAPRDVGDASDGMSEAPGEAPDEPRVGKPEEGSVAPDAKSDPHAVGQPGTTDDSASTPDALRGAAGRDGSDAPAPGPRAAGAGAVTGGAAPAADETGAKGQPGKASSKPATAVDNPLENVAEEKPLTLDGPRAGGADDLKKIKGVGPKIEGILHELGFYHFDQIANWTIAEMAWVDTRLKFKGRILRDDWVGQAKDLTTS
ncbi:NADH-quinone oxidoreductase subunit NuoE [Loktanella sp. SALINAS62]|uniref:NADH-quinone oxidoreductase subunit NuoE n=1 Tax=Loktanella sp. SALINAS62 TaxID=2706124 RepID=UPI001B8B5A0B|nr:NADH-quinone oxidoreductase subunit NuoE [Loktanella sp. SALINAS62]MBS1304210.1 NADH-quinone oxidoreductase subunit NuoE [Loktanella sp. SALINAS62]